MKGERGDQLIFPFFQCICSPLGLLSLESVANSRFEPCVRLLSLSTSYRVLNICVKYSVTLWIATDMVLFCQPYFKRLVCEPSKIGV